MKTKSKVTTIIVVLSTLILAGVAVFTALRLYQLRNAAVAPNVPSSKPAAAEPTIVASTCNLSFSLVASSVTPTPTTTGSGSATPTATSTSSSTPTATATATATSNPQCNFSCTSNSNCPSNLICYIPSGSTTGNCRNSQCLTESDCTCQVATSTPTSTSTSRATATATSRPSLPEAGTSWPTLVGTAFGILVIIGSVLLAL